MHILFLYGSMKKGGAERVIASLSNRFVALGDKVTVAVLDGTDSAYELDARVNFLPLGIAQDSENPLQAAWNQIRKMRAVKAVYRREKPDVLVAFDVQLAALAKLAVPRARVVGSERANPYLARRGLRWKLFVKLSALLDGFVFQTQGAKGFYPKKTQEKSAVIPNGVFCRLPEEIPSYSARTPSVCATGSLRHVKRYDLLLDAFARVSVPLTLHIYGEGALMEKLKAQAESLGISDRVVFEGNCADVAQKLITHRLFVLSSDHEGMPNGLMEALACGCACVSTDCNFGPSELIRDGENGLLVPCGDAVALAQAIERLASDEGLGGAVSSAARGILTTHAPHVIANRFKEYFENICS